jgi:hypothetical protein
MRRRRVCAVGVNIVDARPADGSAPRGPSTGECVRDDIPIYLDSAPRSSSKVDDKMTCPTRGEREGEDDVMRARRRGEPDPRRARRPGARRIAGPAQPGHPPIAAASRSWSKLDRGGRHCVSGRVARRGWSGVVDPDVRDCAGCERNGTTDASGGGGVVLVEDTGRRWARPRRRERERDSLRPGPLTIIHGNTVEVLIMHDVAMHITHNA